MVLGWQWVERANWLWLTAFVGANLLQSGLTNWCLLTSLLARLGVPAGGVCGMKD